MTKRHGDTETRGHGDAETRRVFSPRPPVFASPRHPVPRLRVSLSRLWQHGDRLYRALVVLGSACVLLLVGLIGYELWANSAPAGHS
jgi:hypothetical protein